MPISSLKKIVVIGHSLDNVSPSNFQWREHGNDADRWEEFVKYDLKDTFCTIYRIELFVPKYDDYDAVDGKVKEFLTETFKVTAVTPNATV